MKLNTWILSLIAISAGTGFSIESAYSYLEIPKAPGKENKKLIFIKDAGEPRTITKNGRKMLVLPKSFVEHVNKVKPEWRLPNAGDITGNWDSRDSSSPHPYATWGDYNSDGRTDIGIFLFRKEEWAFTIFLKTDSAYKRRFTNGSNAIKTPHHWSSISTIKKGDVFEWASYLEDGSKRIYKNTYKSDVVYWRNIDENEPTEIVNWENDKLKVREYSYD